MSVERAEQQVGVTNEGRGLTMRDWFCADRGRGRQSGMARGTLFLDARVKYSSHACEYRENFLAFEKQSTKRLEPCVHQSLQSLGFESGHTG